MGKLAHATFWGAPGEGARGTGQKGESALEWMRSSMCACVKLSVSQSAHIGLGMCFTSGNFT